MLQERGVAPEALPSTWSEADQRIVLEILREYLEQKAYAASGETVPERVLREIGGIIADIRKKVMDKFSDPAADPTLTVTIIMNGLYTTLIKIGVPDEAMKRVGEYMAEMATSYPEF